MFFCVCPQSGVICKELQFYWCFVLLGLSHPDRLCILSLSLLLLLFVCSCCKQLKMLTHLRGPLPFLSSNSVPLWIFDMFTLFCWLWWESVTKSCRAGITGFKGWSVCHQHWCCINASESPVDAVRYLSTSLRSRGCTNFSHSHHKRLEASDSPP